VDWEPSTVATPEDAQNYAQYLEKMATSLHAHGIQVTVDIASWSGIWNWTALAATSVDRLITMDTYTNNFTTFASHLDRAVAAFGLSHLGVGLSTTDLSKNSTLPQAEVTKRFNMLIQYGVQEVDIWDMPIPDFWWPLLDQFLGSGATSVA